MKPGRPVTFAVKNGKIVFALPGNPVSAFLTFKIFIQYFICIIFKRLILKPVFYSMENDFKRKNNLMRREYIPCKLSSGFKIILCDKYCGSADLISIKNCNGFFVVPESTEYIRSGSMVEFIPMKL